MNTGPLVVIGDVLLDVDVEGNAERLCPDAPAPVVDMVARRRRPGGAGLAAMVAAREGVAVTLITGRGVDGSGVELADMLSGWMELVDVAFDGTTPCKTRVRAGGRSLVRVDSGEGRVPDEALGEHVVQALRCAGAVLVADYGRGMTHNSWLRKELSELPSDIPLVWDPHPKGAEPIARANLVVPNRSEAALFTDAAASGPVAAATALRRQWDCQSVAVTLGSDGAVLVPPEAGETVDVPEKPASVTDVCGAGDSFASAAASALLRGWTTVDAVRYAVEAASRFVAEGGAGALSMPVPEPQRHPAARSTAFDVAARVKREGRRLVATGGCFDVLHPGHLRLLERARALGDALIVCMNSDDSVRRLKGSQRPIVCAEDRMRLLEALESVDAVAVFDENSPCTLLDQLRPDVWVKGGDYGAEELPEAEVVSGYGGRTVLIPLVDRYSTSRLLSCLQAIG